MRRAAGHTAPCPAEESAWWGEGCYLGAPILNVVHVEGSGVSGGTIWSSRRGEPPGAAWRSRAWHRSLGRGEECGDHVVGEEPCESRQGPAALHDQQVVELVGGAGPQDVGRLAQGDALAQVATLFQEAGVVAGALVAVVVAGVEQCRHVGVA